MNLDDVIYLSLLIFSILFGYYYRKLPDANTKKNVGTIVGLLMVLLVSGIHIIHPLFTTLVNAAILLYVNKKQCHLVSFIFSFLYLLFFRTTLFFGIPYPPGHTNLVQMMLTLKLVGLAFELNTSYQSKKKKDNAIKTDEEKLEDETNEIELNFIEIFHYTFNYVGVLTGPYYRYRTFVDSLNKPYSKYVDWKNGTIEKLKYIPLWGVLFLWATYNWPLSYTSTDEFLNERSWLYRYWYIWPNFFIFRMRIYIGLVLSECVCTMSGMGAYPTFTKPKPGHGPSENYGQLKKLTEAKDLEKTEYNYETIHNINPYGADFCSTYREGMKHWNICIQYWLAVNVYKRFPNKKFRTTVTMMVSAYWHGVYLGYYVCIGTVPFAIAVDDVWVKLLLKENTGMKLKIYEWIFWFFKMQLFSYQAIAFHLLEVSKIVQYYNSVYHVCLIMYALLYVVGVYLLKAKKTKTKKTDQNKEQEEWTVEKKKIN